jgi:hypothetical protein
MRSEEFAKNPIGVDYDPEDLLERHRAGAFAQPAEAEST